MKSLEILIQVCQIKLDAGNDIEDILGFLRKNGCSKSNCITILLKLGYLPISEAQYIKNIVHFSKTWEDLREHQEKWHGNTIKVLNKAE